ncbi:MAG TPA: Gfo/Idh/MocA family oxidoreductase [Tepidisphaeraceae bacterium]|jgi:predicted dehydrogenase
MAQAIRVGIVGAGWPGLKHAEAYRHTSGFDVTAVADLIPGRRKAIAELFPKARLFAQAEDLLKDPQVDAISLCLPNDQHLPLGLAAFKAGKHVLCETPPSTDAAGAKKLASAAAKAGKVLLYAAQRRFGGAEQAVAQAIAKGYIGEPYHARASWMRTRGIPAGTGWYTDKSKSGGGVMIDLGFHILDLAWKLLGQPRPITAFATTHDTFKSLGRAGATFDVEDAAFVLLRFEGGKSLELSSSWAINQPPRHQGTSCRVHGDQGAAEVYLHGGPMLYRNFGPKGEAKESPLKLPKLVLYPALMRHFRSAIVDGVSPSPSAEEAVTMMHMIDAIYKSAASGKSADVKGEASSRAEAPESAAPVEA